MLFECVLIPAQKSEMGGSLAYLLIIKYLSGQFCCNDPVWLTGCQNPITMFYVIYCDEMGTIYSFFQDNPGTSSTLHRFPTEEGSITVYDQRQGEILPYAKFQALNLPHFAGNLKIHQRKFAMFIFRKIEPNWFRQSCVRFYDSSPFKYIETDRH